MSEIKHVRTTLFLSCIFLLYAFDHQEKTYIPPTLHTPHTNCFLPVLFKTDRYVLWRKYRAFFQRKVRDTFLLNLKIFPRRAWICELDTILPTTAVEKKRLQEFFTWIFLCRLATTVKLGSIQLLIQTLMSGQRWLSDGYIEQSPTAASNNAPTSLPTTHPAGRKRVLITFSFETPDYRKVN